jgi:hypothetical protein
MISQIDIRDCYRWNGAFAVIDILGSIPIIVDLGVKWDTSSLKSYVAVVIMVLFLFIGELTYN